MRNGRGQTALHEGVEKGSLDQIKAWKELGADLNVWGTDGRMAMQTAAEADKVYSIKLLKELGPMSEKDIRGQTAMHYAASAGHVISCYQSIDGFGG